MTTIVERLRDILEELEEHFAQETRQIGDLSSGVSDYVRMLDDFTAGKYHHESPTESPTKPVKMPEGLIMQRVRHWFATHDEPITARQLEMLLGLKSRLGAFMCRLTAEGAITRVAYGLYRRS